MDEKRIVGTCFHFDNQFNLAPENFGGIKLFQLGEIGCESGYEIPNHEQWCHEISYIVSGTGYFSTNEAVSKVQSGDIYINSHGQRHSVLAGKSTNLRYAYMGFDFDDNVNDPELLLLKEFYEDVKINHVQDRTDVMVPFFRCFDEFYSNSDCSRMIIESYIKQIVALTYRAFSTAKVIPYTHEVTINNHGNVVYASIKYIEKNICEIHNVKEVSENLKYSNCYLSQLFREKTGMTLQQYINLKKIEKSIEMLKYCKISISQIADKLNYASVQSFNKAFKRIKGCSPTEFIKKLQEET